AGFTRSQRRRRSVRLCAAMCRRAPRRQEQRDRVQLLQLNESIRPHESMALSGICIPFSPGRNEMILSGGALMRAGPYVFSSDIRASLTASGSSVFAVTTYSWTAPLLANRMRKPTPVGDVNVFSPHAGPGEKAEAVPAHDNASATATAAKRAHTPTVRLSAATLSGDRAPKVKISQVLLRNLRGRVHHQIAADLVLGERDDLADIFLTARQHDDSVDAECHAAVGRRPVVERADEEAEPLV